MLRKRLHRNALIGIVACVTWALFPSTLRGQSGLEFLAEQDPDRPPPPPFIQVLGIVATGKMVNDPSLPLKGPVAEVVQEQLRVQDSTDGPAGEAVGIVTSRYDEQGRIVEELRSENGSEMSTVFRYRETRLISQETTFSKTNYAQPKLWVYWTYNEAGHLTEYKRGAGETLQNHLTNFQRDPQGRLLSFEYRQGANDNLFCRTELRYSEDGRTVEISSSDETGVFSSRAQTVNDKGQIVEAVMRRRDSRSRKQKPAIRVKFNYDDQGRLIEQDTAEYDFQAEGNESSLPPGKITVSYDDAKHTRTNVYSREELGIWSSTVTYDPDGAVVEREFEVNGHSSETKVDCAYDRYGNWTNCAELGGIAGPASVDKLWRRTISYRQ